MSWATTTTSITFIIYSFFPFPGRVKAVVWLILGKWLLFMICEWVSACCTWTKKYLFFCTPSFLLRAKPRDSCVLWEKREWAGGEEKELVYVCNEIVFMPPSFITVTPVQPAVWMKLGLCACYALVLFQQFHPLSYLSFYELTFWRIFLQALNTYSTCHVAWRNR